MRRLLACLSIHLRQVGFLTVDIVTWAGTTPDDTQKRNQEREKIQYLAKTDVLAYIQAMKEWGIERDKRFSKEGWRKMS